MSDQRSFITSEVGLGAGSYSNLRMQLLLNSIADQYPTLIALLVETARSGRSIRYEDLGEEVLIELIKKGFLERTKNIRCRLTREGLEVIRTRTGEGEGYFRLILNALGDELEMSLISFISSIVAVDQRQVDKLVEMRILYFDSEGNVQVNILAKRIFSEILKEREEA